MLYKAVPKRPCSCEIYVSTCLVGSFIGSSHFVLTLLLPRTARLTCVYLSGRISSADQRIIRLRALD
jgi:hypothetical protein